MNKPKYARYRIVENKKGSTWKYSIEKRMLWPLPFWLLFEVCDRLDTAHLYISNDKSNDKVVHIE